MAACDTGVGAGGVGEAVVGGVVAAAPVGREVDPLVDGLPVLDPQLRVRGIDGLRVMDCSVLPSMVAGNLNGPMMAMAGVAAEVILDDP